MPPKPTELMRGSGLEFYNIDFSLQNQLRLAGASVPADLQGQVILIIDIESAEAGWSLCACRSSRTGNINN